MARVTFSSHFTSHPPQSPFTSTVFRQPSLLHPHNTSHCQETTVRSSTTCERPSSKSNVMSSVSGPTSSRLSSYLTSWCPKAVKTGTSRLSRSVQSTWRKAASRVTNQVEAGQSEIAHVFRARKPVIIDDGACKIPVRKSTYPSFEVTNSLDILSTHIGSAKGSKMYYGFAKVSAVDKRTNTREVTYPFFKASNPGSKISHKDRHLVLKADLSELTGSDLPKWHINSDCSRSSLFTANAPGVDGALYQNVICGLRPCTDESQIPPKIPKGQHIFMNADYHCLTLPFKYIPSSTRSKAQAKETPRGSFGLNVRSITKGWKEKLSPWRGQNDGKNSVSSGGFPQESSSSEAGTRTGRVHKKEVDDDSD